MDDMKVFALIIRKKGERESVEEKNDQNKKKDWARLK